MRNIVELAKDPNIFCIGCNLVKEHFVKQITTCRLHHTIEDQAIRAFMVFQLKQ